MTSTAHRDWLTRHPTQPPVAARAARRERDAVLACAVGCDLGDVAPFVRSLRAVFSGQIILIVDRRPTLLAWLSTHGVEAVIAADRALRWKPHSAVARFALYAQLLEERSEIRNVILADVRDTVFQSDPFRDPPKDLTLFSSDGLSEAVSGRALHALVGDAQARDLAARPTVTAGVIAAPVSAAIRFCRTLLLLCAAPSPGGASGVDRAACHVIAHLRLAGGAVRPNLGRVAVASRAQRIEEGLILNPDETISPIVLGYARAAEVAAHVERRWGFPPPPRHPRPAVFGRTMRSLQSSLLAAF